MLLIYNILIPIDRIIFNYFILVIKNTIAKNLIFTSYCHDNVFGFEFSHPISENPRNTN